MPRPSLRSGVFWSIAGYGIYMACQWATLVVVARLGSPEKVGLLALGLALSAPVVLFTNLGLRKVQVTDVHGQFHFGDYLGLRLLMTALALAAIAGIASVSGPAAARAIFAVGLAKAVEATSDVVYGVLQQGERMDRIAVSLSLRGILGVGALAAGMALTGDVGAGMLGLAAAWACVLLFHDLPCAKAILQARGAGGLHPRWSGQTLGRLALVALPLGIVTPLVALLSSVPAVLIEKLRGPAELGIYTALAYSYAAANRVASAMGEAACARLASYYARGERRPFARVLGKLLLLSGFVSAAGLALAAVAGRPLLRLFYGPAYADRSDVLVGFMLAAVAGNLACVLDYSMTAMRRLRIQPVLAVGAVLALTALCRHLIPELGLRGAVLALGGVAVLQGAATLAVVAQGWTRFPPLAGSLAPGEA
jgi:O-antigen/teichoic acid export membrane protein